jgi:very-short-patch-repair endonuclease
MTIHYNRKKEKPLRRKLRKHLTNAEMILWQALRFKKMKGLRFKRQYSVDHFVIDFYCPEKKLAVEVDGAIHDNPEIKNNDENREGYLKQFGITFLRFKNEEVEKELEKVLLKISTFLDENPH